MDDAHSSAGYVLSTPRRASKPLDQSTAVRIACLVSLGLSCVVALTSLAASIYLYMLDADSEYFDLGRSWSAVTSISPAARATLDFVLNTLVAICTESMGYIHSVALRWALLREHRLEYSSSLRLLSCARHSWPNSVWANALSAVALVFSDVGASQTFVPYTNGGQYPPPPLNGALANGPALLVLGLGLLVQAVLATACLIKDCNRIRTWSSNVLTVTLACIHEQPDIFQRKEGRCLLSAHNTIHGTDESATRPQLRQPSLLLTDPDTRHIIRFIWFLPLAILVWAIVVAILVAALPTQQANVVGYFPNLDLSVDTIPGLLAALVIVRIFQSFATMGLHAVELLVTRSRDEQCWRRASKINSAVLHRSRINKRYSSIMAALTSWQSLSLYVLKPVIHWLFGNSLTTSNFFGSANAYMDYRFISPLAAATWVFAAFATVLSRHEPRGVMPSSWGHLQTLSNLVDEWDEKTPREIHWGVKGSNSDGTRHAGTAADTSKLGPIVMGAEYR